MIGPGSDKKYYGKKLALTDSERKTWGTKLKINVTSTHWALLINKTATWSRAQSQFDQDQGA